MTTKIRIVRSWDDHEPVILGTVVTDKMSRVAIPDIKTLWDAFKNSTPENDSDFMKLLSVHGYKNIHDDFIDCIVE